MTTPDFSALAKDLQEYVVTLRRRFHEHPELSGQEIWTSERISSELKSLGVPYIVDPKRNVIGRLSGGPGKKLALRADIDALPVTEKTGLPFSSQNPGVMHACGHDGHIAGLLGACRLLAPLKDKLSGTVYFCFQMGEEVSDGALEIAEYLYSEGGVDAVVGTHIMPGIPTGTFALLDGPQMAGVLEWRIAVTGRGGHGSSPWQFCDPIRPACEIVTRVTSLAVNRVSVFDPFVVSPCRITAGTADNIIPESAEIRGTLRYFSERVRTQVCDLIRKIAENVAASHGAQAVFETGSCAQPVENDPAIAARCRAVASALNIDVVAPPEPFMGSDNIGELIARFSGAYYFSGASAPDKEVVLIHNPRYTIDEDVLYHNVRFLSAFAWDFLNGGE